MSSVNQRVIKLCKEMGKASESAVIVDQLTSIYKKYGSLPHPVAASLQPIQISPKAYKLRVDWSHIDFDSVEKVTFSLEYLISLNIDGGVNNVTGLNNYQDTSNELYSVASYDGKWKAIVRDSAKDGKDGKDGKDSQVIEFCSSQGKIKSVNGVKEKLFAKIYLWEGFGKPVWARDNSKLMFIADKYKSVSGFFGDKKKSDDNNGAVKIGDEADTNVRIAGQGDEYLIKEDWGEQLVGSCDPVVCVVDLLDDYKVRVIQVPGFSCSQPFWIDNQIIGFVGIKEESRRLGLIFCPIRKSYLFKCDLRDPESEPIIFFGESHDLAITSPRASYDSRKVVFLCNPPSGPHFQASSLMVLNLEDGKAKTLIASDSLIPNEIDNPSTIKALYAESLPEQCWTSDDKKIIIESTMGYRVHLFTVDCETGETIRVPVSGKVASIMAFCDDLMVVNLTEPSLGCNLHIGNLVNNQLINLFPIDPSKLIKVDELDYKCSSFEKLDTSSNEKHIISTILIGLKEFMDKPSATILCPHGGPHCAFVADFMKRFVVPMVEVGFKILLINYRGSTGLSSNHEKFLCGKVGTTDIADCMEVLKTFIEQQQVNPNEVFLYGGSHGGFIVTHLIGQHSDFDFRACTALNPVTDLAAGLVTSDIPDWHLVEGLGSLAPYPYNTIPSAQLSTQLLSKSPIIHIDKVKTPTLMCLSSKDKRVAMCQGLYYYYGLKARGVPTKCLVYDDNHSIGKLSHDLDVSINSALWFLDHLP